MAASAWGTRASCSAGASVGSGSAARCVRGLAAVFLRAGAAAPAEPKISLSDVRFLVMVVKVRTLPFKFSLILADDRRRRISKLWIGRIARLPLALFYRR